MLTLNHLIETRPDLRLRWAHPAHASTYGETHVAEVTAVVPARQTGHDISSQHLPVSGGGLALVTWGHPPGGTAPRNSAISSRIFASTTRRDWFYEHCRARSLEVLKCRRRRRSSSSRS